MNRLLVLSICLTLASASHAQVVRCVDAAGKVSYTDTACPKGASQSEPVLGPEATQRAAEPEGYRRQEQLDSVERASRLQRQSVETVQRQAQPPGGAVLIDHQANDGVDAQRESDRRRRGADLAAEEAWRQDGYGYGFGYNGRPAARPQDQRPRLTQCDGAGCRDTLGNHYNPGGNVDRFVRPDGRTCRPVGTTVICN